jgi:Tol biopolymer transport system component
MNPDGTQQERLFLASAGACQPRWSPDGTKLAYISPCLGRQLEYSNTSILIYDLKTGEIESLPSEPGGDFDPSWSPDGKYIVFTSRRTGMPVNPYAQIFKIDLEEFQVTRLTTTDATQPARQPVWSPDGSTILYSLNRRSVWQLWSMSVDGENPTQILRSGGGNNDTQPAWARDGMSIYLTQSGTGPNDPARLMQYQLGEESATRLPVFISLRDASPSPDGQWLISEGTDGKNIDIYLFNTITNQTQILTNDPKDDFDPDWQP